MYCCSLRCDGCVVFCRGDFLSARGVGNALIVMLQLALRSSWPCHVSLRGIAPAPQCKEKYLLTILSFYSLRSPFGPAFRLLTLVGRLARSHANPCRFQP